MEKRFVTLLIPLQSYEKFLKPPNIFTSFFSDFQENNNIFRTSFGSVICHGYSGMVLVVKMKKHLVFLDLSLFFVPLQATNDIKRMSTQAMTKAIADYLQTQPVKKAWLFGSFARGEETPESDIDLLVEYDKNAHISLLAISHMMGELEKSTGRRVDLIEEGCLLPFAAKSANRDKKLIYERRS